MTYDGDEVERARGRVCLRADSAVARLDDALAKIRQVRRACEELAVQPPVPGHDMSAAGRLRVLADGIDRFLEGVGLDLDDGDLAVEVYVFPRDRSRSAALAEALSSGSATRRETASSRDGQVHRWWTWAPDGDVRSVTVYGPDVNTGAVA